MRHCSKNNDSRGEPVHIGEPVFDRRHADQTTTIPGCRNLGALYSLGSRTCTRDAMPQSTKNNYPPAELVYLGRRRQLSADATVRKPSERYTIFSMGFSEDALVNSPAGFTTCQARLTFAGEGHLVQVQEAVEIGHSLTKWDRALSGLSSIIIRSQKGPKPKLNNPYMHILCLEPLIFAHHSFKALQIPLCFASCPKEGSLQDSFWRSARGCSTSMFGGSQF